MKVESKIMTWTGLALGLGTILMSHLAFSGHILVEPSHKFIASNPSQTPSKTPIPRDILSAIFSFLPRNEMVRNVLGVCTEFGHAMQNAHVSRVIDLQKRYSMTLETAEWYFEFDESFRKVPEGYLPDGAYVEAFEANSFVTRRDWKFIMDALPTHVPEDLRSTWSECLNCPVTYVNWENADHSPAEVQDFLRILNKKLDSSHCTYSITTDQQLHYMLRGDTTGTSLAEYSTAIDPDSNQIIDINNDNVDDFVIHAGNSDLHPHPIKSKKPNAFGIFLGNAWRMSSDGYTFSVDPTFGRSQRGGDFQQNPSPPSFVLGMIAGERSESIGFALVRTCISTPL